MDARILLIVFLLAITILAAVVRYHRIKKYGLHPRLDALIAEREIANQVFRDRAQKAIKSIKKRQADRAAMIPVYFILDEFLNTVKIGFSKNPPERLADLQRSTAHRLKLLTTIEGGRRLERKLHKQFVDYRLSGEWFTLTGELAEYIKGLTA